MTPIEAEAAAVLASAVMGLKALRYKQAHIGRPSEKLAWALLRVEDAYREVTK